MPHVLLNLVSPELRAVINYTLYCVSNCIIYSPHKLFIIYCHYPISIILVPYHKQFTYELHKTRMDKRLVLLHKQSGCSYPCPCLHRSTISEVLCVSTTPALPCNLLHRYYPCQLESEIRNVTCKLLVDKNFNEFILQKCSRRVVFVFVHPPPLVSPIELAPPQRSRRRLRIQSGVSHSPTASQGWVSSGRIKGTAQVMRGG